MALRKSQHDWRRIGYLSLTLHILIGFVGSVFRANTKRRLKTFWAQFADNRRSAEAFVAKFGVDVVSFLDAAVISE